VEEVVVEEEVVEEEVVVEFIVQLQSLPIVIAVSHILQRLASPLSLNHLSLPQKVPLMAI